MATTKFYLRSKGENCSIYAEFQIDRDLNMKSSTGLKINSNDWSYLKVTDKKTGKSIISKSGFGKPKQNSTSGKNTKTDLENLAVFLNREYNTDFAKGVIFSNQWLKDKINECFERKTEQPEEENNNEFSIYLKNYIDYRKLKGETKPTTERKFNQLKTKFEKFEKKKKTKFLISDIDNHFILTFRKFMIDELKNMDSTANEIIRKLKTVLLNARNIDGKPIHNSINSLKIKSTEATKVFLNFEELEKIKKKEIIGTDLVHARDWLIIGCNTGQRVSDLLRMNKDMIFTHTGSNGISYQTIELTQEKTGNKVSIPINDEVETILEKYNGEFPPTFGKTGDSRFVLFNRYIKKVCELAGIDNIVKGRVFNNAQGVKRNEIIDTEKHKLISSHVCRRSFATNYYGDNRITTPQLMAITGHKTEAVFLNYIGKTSSEHAEKTAEVFRQIKADKRRKEEKIS